MLRSFSLGLIVFFTLSSINLKAEVLSKLEFEEFDIEAVGVADLVNQVKINGPKFDNKGVWGILNWDIEIEYNYRTVDNHCQLIINSVGVIGKVSLPKWVNVNKRPDSIKHWWNVFTTFIIEHEKKHFSNVLNQVNKLNDDLSQPTKYESCQVAKLKYLDKKQKTLQKINKVDIEIDRLATSKFASNSALFEPIRNVSSGFTIQSGFYRSYIGL